LGIRKKAFIIIIFSVVLLTIGVYIISNIFFLGNIELREQESVESDINRTAYLINEYLANLTSFANDWAHWTDTMIFVNNLNDGYINLNLNKDTLANLEADTLVYFDKNFRLRYGVSYDRKKNRVEKISEDLEKYLQKNKKIICQHQNANSIVSGAISLEKGIMLVSASPITDSDYKSSIQGTLFVGRYLDNNLREKIEKIVHAKIRIVPKENLDNREKNIFLAQGNLDGRGQSQEKVMVRPKDGQNIVGYSILRGLNQEPLFLLEVERDRLVYQQGIKALRFFTILFLLFILTVFGICLLFLQKIIISPIISLSKTISNIDLNYSSFNRVFLKGKDEIANLAREINKMLIKIGEGNKEIIASERQLKLVLEGANVGFWDWNIARDYLYLSPKWLEILGYSEEEITPSMKAWQRLIHKDDLESFRRQIAKNLEGNYSFYDLEQRVLSKSGEYKWILVRGKVVDYDGNNCPTRMTGIISDVTEKKKSEEEIRYLSCNDKLTGLFNRGYFEERMDKMNLLNKVPLAVIMGDINGLKLINDNLGREEGDKAIVTIARIFRKCCREDDLITRWGRDEFAILLEEADESFVQKVCARIKMTCAAAKIGQFNLSIALGYSVKIDHQQDIREIVREAEERMHRNKLFEARSARSSVILSLQRTLSERSHETEEHTKRMYDKCIQIAKKLNLTNAQTDELTLLASLHDIGKIGIADNVLNKPGFLDKNEWEIMQTHSEIGYRIAAAIPVLSHIAYGILTHHENYDGTGYPKGLKEEEIPLLSRIIRIVDSYDVMTHERPYKQAMLVEDAIEELKRCCGTQFDPQLVNVCIEIFREEVSS